MQFGELENGPAKGEEDLAVDDVGSATGWISAKGVGNPESGVAGVEKGVDERNGTVPPRQWEQPSRRA